MAETDSGERSEQATPKRLKEAREKGQVARSRELTTAMLLMMASVSLYSFSSSMGTGFANVATRAFSPDRKNIFTSNQMIASLGELLGDVLLSVAPFFLLLFSIALLSPLLTGGLAFSSKAMAPKANRMSPAKGFKRMFGMHALMELVKALAKVSVVFLVGYLVIIQVFPELIQLGQGEAEAGIGRAMDLVTRSFFLISLSLLVIALIDVPYQIWNHAKQLKMTKQEVKDEFKDTEGKPEVKGKIRQMQRELAQSRMMEAIPDADVVVTNPEHYSVALKYDAIRSSAPIVVAKGVDVIAMQIRKVAIANDVAILPVPPLARALYHTTEIDQEVPHGLYLAVAQVLAYIFQMKSYRQGKGLRPKELDELPIPDELKY
ncbi:flagellar biosynthesis protein FlhB [Aliikangiella coralliicola]|uniref:Flagellar biosynthetic protein FlhB n=1 Tax=Aliikangiella coralliicola TaxID=2592383 RepID=A0A545UB55_9GAMM|nr:flagellar biosynthesis protein FlhB [Aliikangiella coralliicola]TQV86699.1 flagellar biosynthesis protein FlhB [Aliikangiella coralliicola]